jgi:sigma54-dependent transcription regulator
VILPDTLREAFDIGRLMIALAKLCEDRQMSFDIRYWQQRGYEVEFNCHSLIGDDDVQMAYPTLLGAVKGAFDIASRVLKATITVHIDGTYAIEAEGGC